MEQHSEPRKPEHTPDNDTTELHEMLQRLNNTYANGQPVRPATADTLLPTPGHVNTTTLSEHGVALQHDLVLPPPEPQTLLHKDGHDTTPQTTSSDTVVSSEPHPVMPQVETQHDLTAQDILGGSCPILPMQFAILWGARKEKEISPLAFRTYFAAHEAKYWRCSTEEGETYHAEPFGFQPSDVGRLLPGVSAGQLSRAFSELEATHILTVADKGLSFAASLEDVRVNERVKRRATRMFAQLHPDTRETLVKIPRRLLKLLVHCGRRLVRAATLLGILLTTMLTKRTEKYQGYQGCCKASWIAKLFGVHTKRVNVERARLIAEGWFRRLPTPQRVRNRWGEWVALNLTPSERPQDPGDTSTPAVCKVQPPHPDSAPELQPPLQEPVPPTEREENQELPDGAPKTGASQPPLLTQPTWKNITREDLEDDARSEALYYEAIQGGYLQDTRPDEINFFAAIAHALRVAKTNVCGLLRTIIEQGLWGFMTQADEDTALRRLRHSSEAQESQHAHNTPARENFGMVNTINGAGQSHPQPMTVSEDALRVQGLNQALDRAGFTGDIFRTVQQHGYLPELSLIHI